MVPLAFRHGRADIVAVEGAPSVGELVQRSAPAARVVSALKNVSAELLQDLSHDLEGDVLICGDDAAARAEVATLVAHLRSLRAVDAGALANARYVEGITALLVNLNRQYRARTSISIGRPAALSDRGRGDCPTARTRPRRLESAAAARLVCRGVDAVLGELPCRCWRYMPISSAAFEMLP